MVKYIHRAANVTPEMRTARSGDDKRVPNGRFAANLGSPKRLRIELIGVDVSDIRRADDALPHDRMTEIIKIPHRYEPLTPND
jgi:hypothetical protein